MLLLYPNACLVPLCFGFYSSKGKSIFMAPMLKVATHSLTPTTLAMVSSRYLLRDFKWLILSSQLNNCYWLYALKKKDLMLHWLLANSCLYPWLHFLHHWTPRNQKEVVSLVPTAFSLQSTSEILSFIASINTSLVVITPKSIFFFLSFSPAFPEAY